MMRFFLLELIICKISSSPTLKGGRNLYFKGVHKNQFTPFRVGEIN